jgi:hypothetical protein
VTVDDAHLPGSYVRFDDLWLCLQHVECAGASEKVRVHNERYRGVDRAKCLVPFRRATLLQPIVQPATSG